MMQSIQTGERIVDRFDVQSVVAENELGTVFIGKDIYNGRSSLVERLNFECTEERESKIRLIAANVMDITHKSIASLQEFIVRDSVGYVVMDDVDGESLESHLAMRRERGQILGLKVAYSFFAHICLGFEVLHEAGMPFGCLTPRNIFVTKQGRIRVANYLCAWLAMNFLEGAERESFFATPFIAPEVREGCDVRPESDVYSLSVLFAELLSGISVTEFSGTIEEFISRIPGVSTAVKDALLRGVKPDIADRFPSLLPFKDALKEAVDAPADDDLSSIVVGVNDLRALMASGDMPVIDPNRGVSAAARKPDLFDSGNLVPHISRPVRQDVWIYVKDGMDYGPFDHASIMQKFCDDEIDESTGMSNTQTKKRQNLGSIEEFKDEIREAVPTRDHNRKVKAEAQRKKQTRVKAAGIGTLAVIFGIIAAIVLVPIVILMLMPQPEPLNMTEIFKPFEKTFIQPKVEEFALNMDDSKAKSLFDPKASAAEREAALAAWEAEHRKKFAGKRRGKRGPAAPGEEIDTIVFTGEDGKELEPLEDWEIEEQVMSPRVYRKQLDCFTQYGGGRDLSGEVKFVINQNGTTRSFSSSIKGELGKCLISSLSSIKFRPFGGTVKRVTLPVGYGR